MVAIVSGNSLGLGLTSHAAGQISAGGSAALGRNGQQLYVNSASGNLILQNRDERLVSAGLDAMTVRTYNSQGQFAGDGSEDNWRIGFYRGISKLTGSLNVAGSTVTLSDPDGAQVIYRFDTATQSYLTSEGSGAHDSLKFDTATQQWTWTDGDTRTVETYDWIAGAGKLLKQVDISGNRVDFVYEGNRLTEVRDHSGEKLVLGYVGSNVSEIRTHKLDGSISTRVRYGYDSSDRLESVTVDLTPDDNSISDGNTYVTAYTYAGDSKRLESILESDGTQVSFTYVQIGAAWHIASMTQHVDGVERKSAYEYTEVQPDASSGPAPLPPGAQTRIFDSLGNVTTITSDHLGRLVSIVGPQVNDRAQSVTYSYDDAGNVLTRGDSVGNISRFEYDARGNQTKSTDPMGNVITRIFGAQNQLLSEYVTLATGVSSTAGGTTYFTYDARNRLRFTLSGEGRVTEYQYDGFGNQTSVISYTPNTRPLATYSESDFISWVNAIADKSSTQRTDIAYDFRGQVKKTTAWKTVNAAGIGVADGLQIVTDVVYDQAGQLLQTIAASGLTTNHTYDGLGRTLTTTDNAGTATTTVYDDAGNRTHTTLANGLVTTMVYNRAGELSARLLNDGTGSLGENRFWYDAGGRLRLTQHPNGTKTTMLYDAAGRVSGEIDGTGRLTEYRYDTNGNRTHSIAYATAVAPLAFMDAALDLTIDTNAPARELAIALTLDAVRPAASADDAKSWNLYDASGRLAWQVDALGYATQTLYDGGSRAYAINRLATPIDVTKLGSGSDAILKLVGRSSSLHISEAGSAAGPNGARTFVAVLSGTSSAAAMSGTVTFFAGSVLLGSATVQNNVATLTAANLPIGDSEITAVYSGDSANAGSNSNTIGATVVAAQPSTVVLAVDLASSTYGASISLTAMVDGGNPSGMVAFYSGTTAVGYAAVVDGVARLSLATLSIGQHRLRAVYLGDAQNAGSSSAELAETVEIAPTIVTLNSSDTSIEAGSPVTFTATVSGSSPTGSITFRDQQGRVLGTARVVNGVASVTVQNLFAGVSQVVAVYSGDGRNGTSVSAAVEERVDVAISNSVMYAKTETTAQGSLLILTTRVTGFNPNGNVSFFGPDASLLGSARLADGYATLVLANPTVAIDAITATYAGDANNSQSTAQLIPVVRHPVPLILQASSATVTVGGNLNLFNANVGGRNRAGTVLLLDAQGRVITQWDSPPSGAVKMEWSPVDLPSGDHVLTVLFSGNADSAPILKTMAVKVNTAPVVVAVSVSDAAPKLGSTVFVTARVSSQSKMLIGGQLVFKNSSNGAVLGTAAIVNGIASISFVPTTTNAFNVNVAYQGDAWHTSTNASSYVTPKAADSVKSVASVTVSAASVEQGAGLTLTARIGTTDGQNTPSLIDSWVYFYNGKTLLGSARTAAGVATLQTTIAEVGTAAIHVVSARVISGNPSYQLQHEATSATVNVDITAAASPPGPVPDSRGTSSIAVSVQTMQSQTVTSAGIETQLVLRAAVSAQATIPSGSMVSFYDGANLIGVASYSGGFATLTLGSLALGDHAFTAVFTGSSESKSSESAVQTFTVSPTVTSTELRIGPTPGAAKNAYTLLSIVTAAQPTSGTVKFYNGAQLLGEANLASGVATLNVSLPSGPAGIRAEYQGNAVCSASISSNVALAVYEDAPSVILSTTTGQSVIGDPVILTAKVSGADPDGMVSFFDGDTLLGSANLIGDTATLQVKMLGLGARPLTALYMGDPDNAFAVSATLPHAVVRGPSLILTAERTGSTASAPVTLLATFRTGYSTGSVQFMDGATVIGTSMIADGQASLVVSRLPAGTRSLRAVFEGNAEHAAETSAVSTESVMLIPSSVSFTSSAATTAFGDEFTLTARVSGDNPTGQVMFTAGALYSDYTVLGTAQVMDGVATFVLTRAQAQKLHAGSRVLQAAYSGDDYNASSIAPDYVHTITSAATSVALSSNRNTIVAGESIELFATVQHNGTPVPYGNVTVYDGATAVGSASVWADGIARLVLSNLAIGTRSLRVTYSSPNYLTSSSIGNLTIEVTPPQKAVTLVVSPNNGGSTLVVPANTTIALTATLNGGSAPSGLVTFVATTPDGLGRTLGSANVVNGVATLNITNADIGTDTLTVGVSYHGDANHASAQITNAIRLTSQGVRPVETRAAAATSVIAEVQTTPQGSRFVIHAVVGDGASATGTLSFFNGTTLLGSAQVLDGAAIFSTPVPSGLTANILAVYSGDQVHAPSTSKATLAAEPAVAQVTIVPFSSIVAGVQTQTPIRISGPYREGGVELFLNGVRLGSQTVNAGMVTGVWTLPPTEPGIYEFTAVFTAAGNMARGSAQYTATVLASTVTTVMPSTTQNIVGSEITLTATVTGNNPTGTFIFYDTNTILGSAKVENGVATLTFRHDRQASRSWRAVYSGDDRNVSSSHMSSSNILAVPSATALASEFVVTESGPVQKIIATVSGHKPTGIVTFFGKYGQVLGTASLSETDFINQGRALLTIPADMAGDGVVTASYVGDANNSASISSVSAPAARSSTVTLSGSSAIPRQGTPFTLTARVDGANAKGFVTFFNAVGKRLGAAEIVDGVARISIDSLPAGSNTIFASYMGDGIHGAGIGSFVQEVAQSLTSVVLVASAGANAEGSPVVLTATVARSGPGFAGGSVSFYNGSTLIGKADLFNGKAALRLDDLPAGLNALSVRYSGDADNAAARSISIDKATADGPIPTSMTLTPASGSSVTAGQNITLVAKISARSGVVPSGMVTFFVGKEVVGTGPVINGVATLVIVSSFTGTIYPSAAYSGDDSNAPSLVSPTYNNGVSNTSTVPVTTTPSVVSFEATPATVEFGKEVTFTASVGVQNAEFPPTGMVCFFHGGLLLGSARVIDGTATAKFSRFTEQTRNVIAIYSGDQNNSPTKSLNAVVRAVSFTPLTLVPTLSVGRSTTGVPPKLRLLAEISYPPGYLAASDQIGNSGYVTFYLGTTTLGNSAPVINGLAILDNIDPSSLSSGDLRAEFSHYGPTRALGVSAPVRLDQTALLHPTITLTTNNATTAVGGSVTLTANDSQSYPLTSTSAATFSFFDGDVLLGSIPANLSQAKFVISNVTAGEHRYRVVFSGNTLKSAAPAYSPIVLHKVFVPTPTVSATEIPVDAQGTQVAWTSPALAFGKVTITVSGNPTPTGSVVLFDANRLNRLGTATVVGGKAIFMVPVAMLKNTGHSYTAQYSGDEFNAPKETASLASSSTAGQNLANPASDTVVLSSRPDPNGSGGIELFALVNGANPSGTVTFKDSYGKVLGISALLAGRAALTMPTPVGGLSGVTAIYSGDPLNLTKTATYSAPGTAVLESTTTSLSVSASAIGMGAELVLTARVDGAGTRAGSVKFYDGSVLLGTVQVAEGQATLRTTALTAGVNRLTAVYSGDASNATSMSAAVDEMVFAAPANVTLSASPASVRQGAPLTLTASVSGAMPSGLVTFVSGKTVLGTASVINGVATLVMSPNPFDAGVVTVIASYAGDRDNAAALSGAIQQTVTPGVKTITLGESSFDRKTKQFFDRDGNVRATLDEENTYTEYFYDAANRLIKSTAYALPIPGTGMLALDSGTTASMFEFVTAGMKPAANAADISTYHYYDNLGQLIAEVNGEGYLTERIYDSAGRLEKLIQYANPARGTVSTSSTLAGLRPTAHVEDQPTVNQWDLHGRLLKQTSPNGTETDYHYDEVGNLVSTTSARNTAEARTTLRRFDTQGRLTAELGGSGSALITGTQTAAEVDAIWAQYATRHAYDANGQRISTTDALGQRTVFFHDDAGRLRFTVNALGEVIENQYDTIGRLEAVSRYAGAVGAVSLALMEGGALSSAQNVGAVAALAAAREAFALKNSVTRMTHDAVGNVVTTIDALDNVWNTQYDAFGSAVRKTGPANAAGEVLSTEHTYNRRGDETATVQRSSTFYSKSTNEYDQLGRLWKTTDFNGKTSQQNVDRLGRVTLTIDRGNVTRRTSYDAFNRVMTTTDGLQQVTSYSYSTAERRMTVTTPENVVTSTQTNRAGQVHSITDGNNNTTTYLYDLEGNLTDIVTPLGTTTHAYDAINRLELTINAEGDEVAYDYDAANRLLTRTLDPSGLKLVTEYHYDAKGQRVKTIDAAGVTTVTEYYLNGAVLSQTVDPLGLNLVTQYTHDASGNTLTVTDARGTVTEYVYDERGRRVRTVADPGGLNLDQTYTYDDNGNLLASVDANGQRTRYAYDELDRLVYTINAAGGVTHIVYDAEGRIQRTIMYATALNTATLPDTITVAATRNLVAANGTLDTVVHSVYDKDGRRTFEIDAQGGVTAYQFDGSGNVISSRAYSTRINMGTWVAGTNPVVSADAAHDQLVRTVYDSLNRPIYTLDGTGAVMAIVYDDNGNVLDRTFYANVIPVATEATAEAIHLALLSVADVTRDNHVHYSYDSAGRAAWETGSTGQVTGYTYDAVGNVAKRVVYANLIGTGAEPWSVQASDDDRVTLSGYDAAGRLAVQIDAAGQVSRATYDNNGNLRSQVVYANLVSRPHAGSNPSLVFELANAVVPNAAMDRVTGHTYDHANRLSTTVQPDGVVSKSEYDGNGNRLLVQKFESEASTEPYSSTRSLYDRNGRAVISIDTMGGVTENRYDTLGNVIVSVQYAGVLTGALPPAATVADVIAGLAPTDLQNRVQRFVYDNNGRVRFSVDAGGYITETRYDALGQVKDTLQFKTAVALADTGFEAAVAAEAVRQESLGLVRVDSFGYDAQGNLTSSTDGLRNTEWFTYDGLGNKTTYTNRLGAIWNYEYDAAGRVLLERAPAVEVMNNALGLATVRLDTRMAYDSFGNLTSRTEAAGIAEYERVTTYEYDVVGRQVKTLLPVVGVYDAAADVNPSVSSVARMDAAPSFTPSVTVTYDAMGNAIRNVDVGGNVTRKVYDRMGQLRFEIDALGFVTGRDYDRFGNILTLTRYAVSAFASDSVETLSEADVIARLNGMSAADHAQDRSITTEYDTLGHAVKVTESASSVYDVAVSAGVTQLDNYVVSKVTETTYNRFGEAIRQQVYGSNEAAIRDGSSEPEVHTLASDTRFYFDQRGKTKAQFTLANTQAALQAMRGSGGVAGDSGGYLVEMQYDDAGNLVTVREYERLLAETSGWNDNAYAAVAAGAGDRHVEYGFDKAGRKTSESRFGVGVDSVSEANVATRGSQTLVTQYDYDKLGNLTLTTDAAGGQVRSIYNAVGYITAVTFSASPESLVALSNFKRDVYGNVIKRTDFATGATLSGSEWVAPSSVEDRITVMHYNRTGQATSTVDAAGNVSYASYDVFGRLAKQWQDVTGADLVTKVAYQVMKYDKLGRVVEVKTPTDGTVLDSNQSMGAVFESSHPVGNTGSWSGQNTIYMRFAELGDEKVFVEFQYWTDFGVEEIVYDDDGYTVLTRIPAPPQEIRSGQFTLENAEQGGTYTWLDQPHNNPNGIFALVSAKVFTFDANGNKVERLTVNSTQLSGKTTINEYAAGTVQSSSQENTYNGFGELIARSHNGKVFEYAKFNNAGQVWMTNAGDGVDKALFYNIGGQVTEQVLSANLTPGGVNDLRGFASEEALKATLALDPANVQSDFVRNETRYDMMGRVIEQVSSGQDAIKPLAQATVKAGASYVGHEILERSVMTYDGPTGINRVSVGFIPPPGVQNATFMVRLDYWAEGPLQGQNEPGLLEPKQHDQVVLSSNIQNNAVELQWSGNPCEHVYEVRIYMKDIAGEWILVGGSEVDSGSYLSVAAPPDPLSTPSLTYWPSGGTGEVTLVSHASLDDTSMFNIAGIPAGTYEYYTDYADSATGNRVEYNRGSFTVHADGSVTVPLVTPPSDSPALVRSLSYQRVDRWGNVVSVTDPRSSAWSTTYTYNANNQVLENQVGTAVTSKYYDALGREVGIKDARGNVTRNVYDKNGNLGDIFYPDGGHTKNLYNLFGDRLSMAQTEGVTTNYAYDHLGRLTSTWAEPVTIYMAFADETGDLAMQPHAIATQPLVDHYTYDSKGRRTSFTNASGDRSTYGYDFDGNLITTTDALLNVTRTKFDAFHHKIAQVDANGNGMTWQVDEFGKVDSHVDLAGVRIDYGYDGMNQLRTQVSSERVLVGRQNLEFTYVGNLLTMIHDKAIGTITTYAYNKAGYRVRERTVAKDDYGHDVLAQNNFIEYDQQGRMTHVADGVFDVRIAYDLNGNRESVQTRFSNNNGVVNNIDERNTFDAMNRVRIANGTLEGASVVIGDKGHDIQYDKAGRRLSDTYLYKHAENNTTLLTTENFTYDGAGRLSTLIRDGVLVDTRLYDGAGRITRTGSALGQDESAIRGFGMVAETRDFAYDRTGNVLRLKVRQLDNLLKDDLYYMAIPEKPANVGYDKVGNLIGYSVVPADYQPHTQYTNRYALFDSYKEEVVLGRTNEVNGSVTTHYDVNGNVVKVTDASRPDYPVARTFINDANGRALLKIDRTGLTRTLIVNGEVLGASTDEDTPNGFANVYQSAVSGANVAAPTIYEVQVSGETPMSIARSIWGDGNLWYLISDANGLGGNETLAAGTVVKVPGKANTVHNDYSTFKPYNPFDAIGSTTPTLPAPAAAEGCGPGGQLIMVVVAVIVTYLTAGQGTGPAWAAMSAMAGSIASQAVGIAIGAQEEFSWTSVAISAISAGVTHGVGALAETTGVVAGSTWQEIATRAMISNAVTQGISNVVGLQDGFSWRSVAAAGAGAAAGKLVGEGIHEAGANFGRQIAERSLSGFAAGVTAAFMRGGKVTIQQVAIDAFGNALGSSLADAMQNVPQEPHSPSTFDDSVEERIAANPLLSAANKSSRAAQASIILAEQAIDDRSGATVSPRFMGTHSIGGGDFQNVSLSFSDGWTSYSAGVVQDANGTWLQQETATYHRPIENLYTPQPVASTGATSNRVAYGYDIMSGAPIGSNDDFGGNSPVADPYGQWLGGQVGKVAAFIRGPVDDKLIGLGIWGANVGIDGLNLLGEGGHSDPRHRLPEDGFNRKPFSIPRFIPANDTQAGAGVVGDVVTIGAGLRKLVPVGANAVEVASTDAIALRRSYLNDKFGRTGNIDVDINIAGNKSIIQQYSALEGLGASDANALMTGIDLTQPVTILKLNRGKNLWQYQSPGAPQGKWYSFSDDVTPSELGIGPYGINRATISVEEKIANQYTTNQSVSVLRSTSLAIEDTWSISPYGSFVTNGGAQQLFSPQRQFFVPLGK